MGLLAKLFGAVSWAEMDGIRLDTNRPFWELSGRTNFPSLLEALVPLLPRDAFSTSREDLLPESLPSSCESMRSRSVPMSPTERFGRGLRSTIFQPRRTRSLG